MIFFVLFIISVFIILYLLQQLNELNNKCKIAVKSKTSHAIKTGKWLEDFFPFMKGFPVSPEYFKFLGEPIDGIAFHPKKIIFMEFKTGNARMSEKQQNIKKLIDSKKVEFVTVRIN